MTALAVRYTVELKLAVDEFPEDHPEVPFGASGVLAGKWKAYPHGWSPPDGLFSERVAAAMLADADEDVLASCRQFVSQQYRTGDAPKEWRIKDAKGKVVESGTEPPPC